jgi:hypothetical protein
MSTLFLQWKADEIFKIVPLEKEHGLQITVSEDLAIAFVAFFIPADNLARLKGTVKESGRHHVFLLTYFATVPEQRAFPAFL